MKNTNIKLTVNESNLVNNLRHAFTRRSNVLSELMQNARRAGASEIRFTITHDRLIVEDNGSGIDDFSNLLTVATSGWDIETMKQESPFGMGFLAALYACRTIQIQSNGISLEADCQDILNQEMIGLTQSLVHSGTLITLLDPDYPEGDIHKDIASLAKGFPIPVFVNNTELERPHTKDNLIGELTENGFIHLKGVHDDSKAHQYIQFYLQGLPIKYNGESSHCGWRSTGLFMSPVGDSFIRNNDNCLNVVHLDSKKHMARVPDRDVLINPDEVEAEIANDIIDIFDQFLKREKEKLSSSEFVTKHWKFIHSNFVSSGFNRNINGFVEKHNIKHFDYRHLFNDVDLLPGFLFQEVTDYPYILKNDEDCEYMEDLGDKLIAKEDIDSTKYQLFSLEELASYNGLGLATAYMYAWYQNNVLILDSYHNIHFDHWINKSVEAISDVKQHFSVEVIDPIKTASFVGNWIYKTNFHFAKECLITHNLSGNTVKIDSDAFVLPYGSVIYPEKEDSGFVVAQLEKWVDESEQWASDDQDEEETLLNRFVLSERAQNDIALLHQLLTSADIKKYSILYNKNYLIKIDQSGHIKIN